MNKPTPDEDVIEMFADVERRVNPPQEVLDRAYAAIEKEWKSVTSQYRGRSRRRWFAAAAAIAVAAVVGWTGLLFMPTPTPQAYLVQGDIVMGKLAAPVAADPGALLLLDPQTDIVSRTASRWISEEGVDIRLAPDSRMRWVRANEIDLLDGTVYVSTDGDRRFAVETRFGRVVDIGTRYLVCANAAGIEVAVREGRIHVTSKQHGDVLSSEIDESTVAIIVVDGDGISASNESSIDPRWAWIHDVPAGYASDETLVLLREIVRDLGKRLRFRSRGVEASLALERVDGDFTGMAPMEALQILGAASNIEWRDEGEELSIDLRR